MEQEARPSGFREKYGPLLYENIPYQGEPLLFKSDDPDYKLPVLCTRVNTRRLDTSIPEEMEEWTSIVQRKADGVAEISFEEKQYDEASKHWIVLIRWIDLYYTSPERAADPIVTEVKDNSQKSNISGDTI